MIVFETERLLVRRFEGKDMESFKKLNQDPEVMKHIGPPRTNEEIMALLRKVEELYTENKGLGRWAVIEKSSGSHAGTFMLRWSETIPGIELGYSFLKEYWGKGYATELVKAGLAYAFQIEDINEIFAIVEKVHPVSEKVLVKCGFGFVKEFVEKGVELNLYSAKRKV